MIKVLELFGEPFLNGGQEAFVMNLIQANKNLVGKSRKVFADEKG